MSKPKVYDLGFSHVEIYTNYLVNTIAEGFLVLPEHNDLLEAFAREHFQKKFFVYISNRINSYSVDPTVYLKTSSISNLKGMAVVSINPVQQKLTELENTFFKKELRYFKTIKEALAWKDQIL